MYAVGGLMGVLVYSSFRISGIADRGVLADRAESSEGKVAVTGVFSCASLGLLVGAIVGGGSGPGFSWGIYMRDVIYHHRRLPVK